MEQNESLFERIKRYIGHLAVLAMLFVLYKGFHYAVDYLGDNSAQKVDATLRQPPCFIHTYSHKPHSFEPLIEVMTDYTMLVGHDDGSSTIYTLGNVAPVLRGLRRERRRYYEYIDQRDRQARQDATLALTPRQKRSLRYYLYSIEQAITHLELKLKQNYRSKRRSRQ